AATGTPGTPAAAAAAAPRRSWMGPIAGLAAGLGIAALMSHLGLGAAFGNILMMVLLGVGALFAVRFLMRRFSPAAATSGAAPGSTAMQFAGPAGTWGKQPDERLSTPGSSASAFAAPAVAAPVLAAQSVAGTVAIPAGFDSAGFERIAKMIFIRMQAANDTADLNDLRAFTTPEMFASVKLDLQDRGGRAQQTDVVKIDAEVLEVAAEGDRQIVSVRFHGLIREEQDGTAAPFDEVWHLVRPTDGSREWAIAGIQQMAPA
ncbi:MAG: Tim44-like domain-containing protein, partial [Pseudomonadota bacterium]|nr:Tim44-like domain-containing protein [Pseudomonadota bacterium]